MYEIRLFVDGNKSQSARIIRELKSLLKQTLKGRFRLEVVDVFKHPEKAERNKIIAIPTLERVSPRPIKRIIGDLSNGKKVSRALDLN